MILILSTGCKKTEKSANYETLTEAERIAKANGFDNWEKVSKIDFTFVVDRDSIQSRRSWQWEPKTNHVVCIVNKDTTSYNRKSVDSTSLLPDKRFINDKFWMLFPFQLVWDEGTTLSESVKVLSPINNIQLNKLTITYSDTGGYTPGDAYDVFYNDDYMIEEWIFRRGNAENPSLICTFENYKEFNGIKIATEHKKPGQSWNLKFEDIRVILEE